MSDESRTNDNGSEETSKPPRFKRATDVYAHQEQIARRALQHVGSQLRETAAECADPRRLAREYPKASALCAAAVGAVVARSITSSGRRNGEVIEERDGKRPKRGRSFVGDQVKDLAQGFIAATVSGILLQRQADAAKGAARDPEGTDNS